MSLKNFFHPKNVAVIGASRAKGKVGFDILYNLKTGGFEGGIFPVNPKADEILGLKCYPDLASIPETPDLAVIVLPAKAVINAVRVCGDKGIKAVIVISAGFKEVGEEGRKLEQKLVNQLNVYDMRLIGPNCLGVSSTGERMNASFGAMPIDGNIALISQSGALITGLLDTAKGERIGFSSVVSIGNKADVREDELIGYFADDPSVKVIAGYLENIGEGEKFIHTVKNVVPEKPVIVIKSGRTSAGAQAASSHTGSLGGQEEAYQCAFRRSGIIRADSIEHLFDMLMLFSEQPLPGGDRFAVITNAGGPGIMAADACESAGLTFAALQDATKEKLASFLPSAANIHNPIDVLGDSDAERYATSIEMVLSDPGVDILLVLLTPQAMTDPEGTARGIIEKSKASDKTVVACFIGCEQVEQGCALLRENKIPVYREPERAVAAIRAACDYVEWCEKPPRVVKRYPVNKTRVEKMIRKYRRMQQTLIGEQDAKDIFEAYGINTPAGSLVRSAEEAVRVADRIGYPIVMKVASQDISHKSDLGGVKIGLPDAEAVADAYELMMLRMQKKAPNAVIEGVTVQEMIAGGKEVIIGMTRNPQFGPLLLFGLGGIYVEVLKDVAFELAPLTEEEAHNLITSTKTYTLLQGVRGEASTDINAIGECLQRIGQLVTDFPEIQELDINPMKVKEVGHAAVAIDARIGLMSQ